MKNIYNSISTNNQTWQDSRLWIMDYVYLAGDDSWVTITVCDIFYEVFYTSKSTLANKLNKIADQQTSDDELTNKDGIIWSKAKNILLIPW